DGNGIGDVCELTTPTLMFDTISTSRVSLVVANTGNFGNQGTPGVTMDYSGEGDCEAVYLYDASPVLLKNEGGLTLDYHMFGNNTTKQSPAGQPTVPPVNQGDFVVYESGTIITNDGTLAMEKTWWAPQDADTNGFVIQRLRLFPWDGQPHDGLVVGEALDWDIPAGSQVDNNGGFDASAKLIYQVGTGFGCLDNTHRFGGIALLAVGGGSGYADTSAIPYGAYTESNPTYVYPTNSFVPSELYNLMKSNSGYSALSQVTDQHSVMTYFDSLSLGATDTVSVFTVITTVKDGTAADLINNVMMARAWFAGHINLGTSSCCIGSTGNVDGSPSEDPDIADLTALIDHLFISFSPLPCVEEADVDSSGGPPDIADATALIDHLFISFAPTAPCQ
ncbi:MAG: hypothetical protein D6800_01650, partial [Candidatus Zixiibacteriota bacterium]